MHGTHGTLQNLVHHLLEARARQLHHEVLRTARIRRDERQIDLGFEQRRELDLGLFGRLAQALQRHLIFGKIDAVFVFEVRDDPVDNALVDVVAAKVRVTVGRLHFDDAVADFEDRNIESAATEIEHRDHFIFLLVEAVGQGRRRRFIDDALDLQSGDASRVLGRLALCVVKVRRDRNHGFRDLLAQVGFGRFLQLRQNHRRDLRRGVLLAADVDAGVATLAAAA